MRRRHRILKKILRYFSISTFEGMHFPIAPQPFKLAKNDIISKQGNRGDMWKIHVKRQFIEASCPQGHFFEKTKHSF